MRTIRLSGREMSMMRAIGFGMGASGKELIEVTSFDTEDLLDLLNGMLNAGFIITTPYLLDVGSEQLLETHFEVNPAYAKDIRKSLYRKF